MKSIDLIKKYGLKLSVSRGMSLFLMSCVSFSYLRLLKKVTGFSYDAVGSFSEKGANAIAMFNVKDVNEKTRKLVKNQENKLYGSVFEKTMEIFRDCDNKFKKIDLDNPWEALNKIIEFYPSYFIVLGVYSTFLRYIGDDAKKIDKKLLPKITKERDDTAKFYFKVEKACDSCYKKIGKEIKIKGSLLRYLSYEEMKNLLKTKKISKKQKDELVKRSKGYLYLYDGKDHFATNKKELGGVNKFFETAFTNDEIRGTTICKGVIKGIVYNSTQGKIKKLDKKSILVSPMTRPVDTSLMVKAGAIVTDEGGILCHAAVVAREFKIPCIISTKIATKVLKNGDEVEVNANNGIVKILKKS